MAVAGLVAVGAAALNYDSRFYDWPDRPIYVAEATPLSAADCRGWQSRAQRRALAFPGSWEAYEGFSRLQGACHPKDIERGRAMIESALAKGAGRFLIVEYVMALRAVGDYGRAAAEFPLAAMVMVRRVNTGTLFAPAAWRELAGDVVAEVRLVRERGEWAGLQARLDHLLSRAPILADVERIWANRLLVRMDEIDRAEGRFQRFRFVDAGRDGRPDSNIPLSMAAGCGHPTAIRLLAQRNINGATGAFAGRALEALVWLDAQTGAEGPLVEAVLARYPGGVRDRDAMVASLQQSIDRFCRTPPAGERR
jgi:hypothetical protein